MGSIAVQEPNREYGVGIAIGMSICTRAARWAHGGGMERGGGLVMVWMRLAGWESRDSWDAADGARSCVTWAMEKEGEGERGSRV